MTIALPGTLPEETEVKLSEFLAMADGDFSMRQMEHKSLLKYSLSSNRQERERR